jgi:predicted regulator of Ras-like GTPase activity (Roadblock/LC7/MglB family)
VPAWKDQPLTLQSVDLRENLRRLLTEIEGSVGAAVGGLDGLLVEQADNGNGIDLAAVIAEHASILRYSRAAYTTSLQAGEVSEVIITAEHLLGYTRAATDEYFLTIVLEPRGNLGRARLLAERFSRRLAGVLA